MESINSSIRVDLPVSPNASTPALFNELLVTYSGIRALHSAAENFFPDTDAVPEEYDVEQAIGLYTVGAKAKVLLPAGEAITAGRFLETYMLSGRLSVRHTRCSASRGVSWHSLGLCLENVAAGQLAQVYITPAIIPGFVNLVPGKSYFYYDNGQFTDYPLPYPVGGASTVSVTSCGVAITANHMQLRSFHGPLNV